MPPWPRSHMLRAVNSIVVRALWRVCRLAMSGCLLRYKLRMMFVAWCLSCNFGRGHWRLAVAVSNELAWRQRLVMWRLSWQGSQLQRAGIAAVVCAYMHTPD